MSKDTDTILRPLLYDTDTYFFRKCDNTNIYVNTTLNIMW